VSRLSSLEKAALHDRADLLRKEVVDLALERGRAAFHRNDMAGVVSELTRFQALNPPQDELLDSSFFLGVAYNQLKKHDLAVPQLARFVEQDKRSHSRDYGMLLLAQSYEAIGQAQKAADTARAAIQAYPNSQFSSQLRGRLARALRSLKAQQPKVKTPPAAPVTPADAAAAR
jgi:tetratricopeptide (TPR) repeat protein